ncbi:HEAT repeat domain-containing protein [Roseiflexus sp.]|uniref:HEAT repeat domain-containing protein n=1 Tax=Roseiflexus sp. TaxID=2562120 RepID=UPI00398A7A83
MFDQHIWRQQLTDHLEIFARHPHREVQLAGNPGVVPHLALRTLMPFLNALYDYPVDAIVTLATIAHDTGANLLISRIIRTRYPTAIDIERDMRASIDLCITIERLMIELNTIPRAIQRLNARRSFWLCSTIERELDVYPWSFVWIRDLLRELNSQDRIDALRRLRSRNGRYTTADLALIESALSDATAQTRAYAARLLGVMVDAPPPALTHRLLEIALRDSDAETRFAAARTIGLLRERVITGDALTYIESHLFHEDGYYRSSAALVLGQLGEDAGKPSVVQSLCQLLHDRDAYAREAAARALGRIGPPAALPQVIAALEKATQDDDVQVHEAATDSLALLRQFAELSVQAAA